VKEPLWWCDEVLLVVVLLVVLVELEVLVERVELVVLEVALLEAGHDGKERGPPPGVAIKIAAPNPGIESGQEY
jgi:hypothetical protein